MTANKSVTGWKTDRLSTSPNRGKIDIQFIKGNSPGFILQEPLNGGRSSIRWYPTHIEINLLAV